MPRVALVSVLPEDDLLASSQGTNIGSTATSLSANPNSITANQTRGTRQLQEPSSTFSYASAYEVNVAAVGAVPVESLDEVLITASLSNNTPASSTRTSVGTQDEGDSETANQDAHIHSISPFPTISKVPSMALEPSITADNLNLKTSSGEVVLTNGASTNTPSPAIDPHLTLISGTQSATANSKSGNISPSSQILSLGSTSTLGYGTPTSVSAPSKFDTQHIMASDSATSLSPHATALPDFSKSPPALTIGEQTITADSLGKYLLGNQTLTRGGVITVSGTTISLAPNASDVVVGTSTEALRPTLTAGLGSGANGTKVQKFRGDALGVRDGLWGSSLMLLVSVFVLLWL